MEADEEDTRKEKRKGATREVPRETYGQLGYREKEQKRDKRQRDGH